MPYQTVLVGFLFGDPDDSRSRFIYELFPIISNSLSRTISGKAVTLTFGQRQTFGLRVLDTRNRPDSYVAVLTPP